MGEEILSPCERLRDFGCEPTFKLKKVPGMWQWNMFLILSLKRRVRIHYDNEICLAMQNGKRIKGKRERLLIEFFN